MSSLGDSVWNRRSGIGSMSKQGYIAAVSGFTVYGLLLASAIAYYTMSWQPNIWIYLLIGLGIPVLGIFIALGSSEPIFSMLGYTMVVVGMGAIMGPSVAMYQTGVVVTALFATAGVTIVMSFVGIIYPKSLESWGGYLFGGLVALLLVRVAQGFMMGMGLSEKAWGMPFVDYLGAALFSLYIIYDWNRAVRLAHTLDNAIDCALAIFLDVINLFINLLRILGSSRSSSSSSSR